ncbi:plancitoxin-1 [Lingula anatina]|uniref:Plancitoxin-1 n=1 Tax=Lingula anatina TaxID=7574 RepID=A0A1S3HEU6_LINAN|nr:plancitoxin-1 [Lingula anatina]|eukprot:XP_013384597.1 plancitoxin-1 [Lingula anatina]
METPFVLLFICCLSIYINSCWSSLQCVGENGKAVDWFIAYKIPKIAESSNPFVKEGLAYFYMDNNTVSVAWALSNNSLNGTGGAIYKTLEPLYKAENTTEEVAFGMYNDETPSGEKTEEYGHTKGVLAMDVYTGFWMVHSVPRFPEFKKYSWPESARENGQSFLCISITHPEADTIAQQMTYNRPWIYGKNFPAKFEHTDRAFLGMLHGKFRNGNRTKMINSAGGEKFLVFAKDADFGADLYDSYVGPYLASSLYTETWQNGPGKTPSYCKGPFHVENIQSISFPKTEIAFKETKDHSKWAVTVKSTQGDWTCIGDINRQEGQLHRGGGTVCMNNRQVWKSFSGLVGAVEHCKV